MTLISKILTHELKQLKKIMLLFIMVVLKKLIFVIFILAPLVGFYYLSKESINSFYFDSIERGLVVSCKSKRQKGTSKSSYSKFLRVKRDSGSMLVGKFTEIKFFYRCKDQIGKRVEVKFDSTSPKNAIINTFHEVWLFPLLGFIFCLFWLYVLLGPKRK